MPDLTIRPVPSGPGYEVLEMYPVRIAWCELLADAEAVVARRTAGNAPTAGGGRPGTPKSAPDVSEHSRGSMPVTGPLREPEGLSAAERLAAIPSTPTWKPYVPTATPEMIDDVRRAGSHDEPEPGEVTPAGAMLARTVRAERDFGRDGNGVTLSEEALAPEPTDPDEPPLPPREELGGLWTDDEDSYLLWARAQEPPLPWGQIAHRLNRTPGAINARKRVLDRASGVDTEGDAR